MTISRMAKIGGMPYAKLVEEGFSVTKVTWYPRIR